MAKEEKEKNKKVEKTKKKTKKTPKESYLKGVNKELKLVKWPTFKEIIKYTIATIIFCIILILFFELLTFIVAMIRELFN